MDTIDSYKIITITHRDTRLNEVGQFVLSGMDNKELMHLKLSALKEKLRLKELMYLATCNRVTFFFVQETADNSEDFLNFFFHTVYDYLDATQRNLGHEAAQFYGGLEAIEHLFEVAASMDSLVVGEREILRQLREAYLASQQLGLTGDSIRLAMRFAVEIAKRVYSNTRIGEKPVSVVSLAIQKLTELQLPNNARLLMLGAGQTNRLVLKLLGKKGFTNVTVFNRSLRAAQELAETVEGNAYTLEALSSYSHGFDVVVAASGATEYVLTSKLYATLLGKDTDRKVLIDLSIPNNIDPLIAEFFNAEYIPIESLRQLAKENLQFREQELSLAKELVRAEVEAFGQVFNERQIERALQDVPNQIKAIKSHAMNNVFKQEVENLDDESRELLERMMAYMEKRCIAIPIQVAKERLAGKKPVNNQKVES